MAERQDYSGAFDPDITLVDFSKEAHMRLCKAATKMYLNIDAAWRAAVEERFGKDVSLELSRRVWFEGKNNGCFVESTLPRVAMNINGSNMESWLKHLQIDPALAGIADVRCELTDESTGYLTVNRCEALEELEKLGDEALQKYVCEELEWKGLLQGASYVNPRIRVEPLEFAQMGRKDGCACKWKFTMADAEDCG